jgi:hypothetical protein
MINETQIQVQERYVMFEEAYSHVRWKYAMTEALDKINIMDYQYYTFEEIISNIYDIVKPIKGLGMLSVYDITSAICRFYNKNIEKVYIVGGGPRRAIKILGIIPKKHKINKITLSYVEIFDIITAFDNKSFELDEFIRNTTNGDIIESYICNWQKSIYK